MNSNEAAAMEEVWFSDILDLPSLFSSSMHEEMINENQCFVLYTLADCVAHYTRAWWNNLFREEILKSTSAARVGMELLKGLNKGLQLLQLCAGNNATVVWTIVRGAGPFREVIEDVKRYAQMMNCLIGKRSDLEKHKIAEQLRHQVEFDCRVLQTSLGFAYRLDRITILEGFKSRQSSNTKGKGLLLDDALLSCLISILEKRLPSDIAKSNLCEKVDWGNGAYGSVKKAKCFNLPVAVKKFRCKESCEIELKIFKKFLETDYPFRIVGILGCSDKSIVLELMDKNLKELLEENLKKLMEAGGGHSSPFSLDQSLDIMLQIAEGMKCLHAQNVIYRDLKPANVLIQVREGQSLVIKLADFGVSKEQYETKVTNTANQGTLSYMAPEMMNMEEGFTCKYTRKVDVHSFGMVCCEILTGKQTGLPLLRLMTGERPPLPQDIPVRLGRLIQHCWDPKEENRPQFEEICDELWLIRERSLTDECKTEDVLDAALDDSQLRCLRVENAPKPYDHVERDNSRRSDWDASPARIGMLLRLDHIERDNFQRSVWNVTDPSENFIDNTAQLSVDEKNGNLRVAQSAKSEFSNPLMPWNKKEIVPNIGGADELSLPIEPKKFTYTEILGMTRKFKEKIGDGGSAEVFKGWTKTGIVLAVKVIKTSGTGTAKDFQHEISVLSVTQHYNLLDFLGYCTDNGKMILVYKFMVNGSLDRWIFKNSTNTVLSWETRFKIITGVASGLYYLHEQCGNIVLHLDLKPGNILLDEEFVPNVADFGLSRLLDRCQSMAMTVTIRGTPSYMAPETIMGAGLNHKTDVYSFGIIMLETVAARSILHLPGATLAKAVTSFGMRDYFPFELVDAAIHRSVNRIEAKRVLQVAFFCLLPNLERPSMRTVLHILQGRIPIRSMSTQQVTSLEKTFAAKLGGMPLNPAFGEYH